MGCKRQGARGSCRSRASSWGADQDRGPRGRGCLGEPAGCCGPHPAEQKGAEAWAVGGSHCGADRGASVLGPHRTLLSPARFPGCPLTFAGAALTPCSLNRRIHVFTNCSHPCIKSCIIIHACARAARTVSASARCGLRSSPGPAVALEPTTPPTCALQL